MSNSNRGTRDANNEMPIPRSGASIRLRGMGIPILSNNPETNSLTPQQTQPISKPVHDCDKGFVVRLESGKLWCTACGDLEEV